MPEGASQGVDIIDIIRVLGTKTSSESIKQGLPEDRLQNLKGTDRVSKGKAMSLLNTMKRGGKNEKVNGSYFTFNLAKWNFSMI